MQRKEGHEGWWNMEPMKRKRSPRAQNTSGNQIMKEGKTKNSCQLLLVFTNLHS